MEFTLEKLEKLTPVIFMHLANTYKADGKG